MDAGLPASVATPLYGRITDIPAAVLVALAGFVVIRRRSQLNS
jgi:hypothetical protein